MKIRIIILIGFFTLLAVLALAVWGWYSAGPHLADASLTLSQFRVRKQRFVSSLFVTGELAAVRAINITAPPFRGLGPFAIKAMAPEGSHVEPGDLLVQIDNSVFVSKLQTEEMNLEKAENDLVKTQAQLEVQIKDLEIRLGQNKFELERDRLKAEIDKNLISLRDWQDYQFAFQKAKKEYEKTSGSLELVEKAAEKEISLLRLRRDQIAELIARLEADIAALEIQADQPGTVLYEIYPPSNYQGEAPRKLQVGDNIFWGWSIISLPDLTEMEVHAFVSEVDGGLLHPGQRVRIVADSHPDLEFGGTLTYVPELAENPGMSSNIRVFISTIKLDNTDTRIMRPGMTVRAEIILAETVGLVLPRKAVSEDNGRFYVLTLHGGRTEVQVRARNAVWCLIEGLPEDTEVRL